MGSLPDCCPGVLVVSLLSPKTTRVAALAVLVMDSMVTSVFGMMSTINGHYREDAVVEKWRLSEINRYGLPRSI